MGSQGHLFDILPGKLVEIVDYATNCHKQTGRAPRLAVNANSWWNANMTAAAAQSLRDTSKEGVDLNPIERNILFYTLRIRQLGFQLFFVFDGPKRLSNGGKVYPGHDPPTQLYRQMLTQIEVPWHEAPCEAEAECAKMESEGIVDGVWSEDGDALAFGSKTLIKFHVEIKYSTENREETRKSSTHFKIYELADLEKENSGTDRDGFVLHAILNDRPRNTGELCNLSAKNILHMAGQGLGKSLIEDYRLGNGLESWSGSLGQYLTSNHFDFKIPPHFPTRSRIQDYLDPIVSNSDFLSNLHKSGINKTAQVDGRPPNTVETYEAALFSFLFTKFQFTISQYIKHILPVQIIQSLLDIRSGQDSSHDALKFECDLKKPAKKVKATFLLSQATTLDVTSLYALNGRGVLETLPWILRKANCNNQRSIAGFFTPPKSARPDKEKNKSPTSRRSIGSARRLNFELNDSSSKNNPPTPSSRATGSRYISHDGSPSSRSYRDVTPPSPTPLSAKRKRASKTHPEPEVQPFVLEPRSPKRVLSKNPTPDSSLSTGSQDNNPSPGQEPDPFITATHIKVSSSTMATSKESMKTPEKVSTTTFDSDSEDAYGSFPSSRELLALLDEGEDVGHRNGSIGVKKVTQGEGAEESDSDDYGSELPSPVLRALG